MKYFILLLTPLASSAFVIKPFRASIQLKVARKLETESIRPVVDIERARECAQQFGKCDLEEVEELRDALHKARIGDMFLGNVAGGDAHIEDKLFEERLLEEDLSLQIDLLKKEMPESTLFPEEVTMHPEHFEKPKETLGTAAVDLLDENLLESLAICAVFGVLLFAPHLLHI
jgi:hypothetical protein